MANILITGATGTIGTELAKHLIDEHALTLVGRDFSEYPDNLLENAKVVKKDLVERDSWDGLLDEAEYIIQLAGQAAPDAEYYGDLRQLNYDIPYNLFDEAKDAPNLKRVIYASSIHAVSAYPQNVQVKATDPTRPADLYGVSKVYLEGLATYHAYKNGVESIGIRIANYRADNTVSEEADEHGRAMYFSKDDMNRLIDCCLETELDEPALVVNGISANTFPRLSFETARVKLGYEPQDNAFEL